MKLMIVIAALLLSAISMPLKAGNEFCGLVRNLSFQAGETLTYKVFYTLANVYVGAGEVVFSNALEKYAGKDVYHVTGEGKTFPFYDKFYRVRDKYESFIDTSTLQPYKFVRNVDEGGFKTYENISFIKNSNTAVTNEGVYSVPSCIQDVLSAVFYTRNIDFTELKEGDKIPFDMFLDRQVYHLYVRYMGRDKIRTKYGRFKALKFKPLLIKSEVFAGGEKMTLWVSDDPNHIALRIETPISVGSIKVDMTMYKNLRYPLTSLIDL